MHFETLLAIIAPGLLAPLLLMAGGFLLAVGGATFVFWRRKKTANPESGVAEFEVVEDALPDETKSAFSPESAPVQAGRRRSLVADAERQEGTPSGEFQTAEPEKEPVPAAELAEAEEPEAHEAEIEEAEFTDCDEATVENVPEPHGIEGNPDETSEPELAEEVTPVVVAAVATSKSPDDEDSIAPTITAARMRPIVFRQFLPKSPADDGLSFYGGKPIGPEGFEWPRGRGAEGGQPLTFIMQWDCTQLSQQDETGLLPEDGVLYCFLNLDWGNGEEFIEGHRFIHHSGPTDGWTEIDTPEDAPPVFGPEGAWQISGCSNQVDNAEDFVPRLMPRFPFEPIAFEYPSPQFADEESEQLFWTEDHCAEAVLAAQQSGIEDDADIRDLDAPKPGFARPFPSFPHDFGAIRVLAAKMIEQLQRTDRSTVKKAYPDLSDEDRKQQFESWLEEAKELYNLGCQRPLGHSVEQEISDDIWQWVEARKTMIELGFYQLVEESIDLSLGVGSEALPSVPHELIEDTMRKHAFASEYITDEYPDHSKPGGWDEWQERKKAGELKRVRHVHAPTPEHMFGPPSFVQGYVEDMVDDHLLLLELPGYSGPEHHFGEGVLQYLIKPEDLAAGRFDQVKSVLSGY
ncbi:DUF1963 domain-containing protein [uncultured Erythrobacter sp.]|uniref:DUF1963 domain-containing protein n=1 Tax=uncultured Erythrobacter sp. TaxID=263913 RepID=UPI00262302B2|nr:DUF1963 domain-containing protein [uncultured Erythrobacter sp.]